jgi:hypothetical protein
MSIATLKRKTLNGNPRLGPISGANNGSFGFSLNGTRRNIGQVGVTNLAPGAQTGPRQAIQNSVSDHTNPNGIQGHPSSCCTNDPTVVKPSVINTRGMLSRRRNCLPPQHDYRSCTNCGQPELINGTLKHPPSGCVNWVKEPLYNGDQGLYISYGVRSNGLVVGDHTTMCNLTKSHNGIIGVDSSGNPLELGNTCSRNNPNFIGTRRITNKCTIAKPGVLTVNYATYMLHKGVPEQNCQVGFWNPPRDTCKT